MTARLVYEDTDRLLAWAEKRTPTGFPFRDDATAIGLERAGALVAVVIFDTFTPWECQLHICAEGRHWTAPELWRAAAAYAFIQCSYQRVTAQISVKHRRALALARAMGFVREGFLRHAGIEGEGMVALAMYRGSCRWLPRTFLPLRPTRILRVETV